MSILMAVLMAMRIDAHRHEGAGDADGGAIVIEVRASALFECLGGWV
jgi:hypothetical protein